MFFLHYTPPLRWFWTANIKDVLCAGSVNCSFSASGEDKREEVFIIWEEKQRDPFTVIMLQEVECRPHL